MGKIFVRNPYNYDMDEVSEQTGLKCLDKSLTHQSFAEEADINTIVERFHLTGQLPQFDQLPTFGDFEGIFDFQSAMNAIRASQESFMELPANLRARFHNNPQEFLEFCSNEENLQEAKKLGILSPEALQRLDNPQPQGENDGQSPPGRPQGDAQGGPTGGGAAPAQGAPAGPKSA